MDPYDLPDQLSVLMSYDIGRIGFIQDLIRGVDKVLSAEKKDSVTETVKETVVVQQGGGPNITALIKRGYLALEDGEWEKANSFFDQVLNMDAECAEAYLGQGLAAQKCHDTEEYIRRVASRASQAERKYISKNEERIRKARETYPVEGFLKWEDIKDFYDYDLGYNSSVNAQKEVRNSVIADFEKDRCFARAKRFSSEEAQEPYNVFRKELIDRLTRTVEEAQTDEKREITRLELRYDEFLKRADQKAEVQHNAAVQKREEHYLDACQSQEKATGINAYQAAISKFKRIVTYKDSLERINQCEKSISDLEELEKQRIAAEERMAAEKREQERLRKEEEKRIAAKAAQEKPEQERIRREEEKRLTSEKAERERLLKDRELLLEYKRKERKKKANLIAVFFIIVLAVISVFLAPTIKKASTNKIVYDQKDYKMKPSLSMEIEKGNITGVYATVYFESVADKAGLKSDDVIIALNGQIINSADDFRTIYDRIPRDQEFIIELFPGGEDFSITIPPREDMLGISIGNSSKLGLIISEIAPGGTAEKSGLKVGDMIVKIGEERVMTQAAYDKALNTFKPGQTVDIIYLRDNVVRKTSLTVEESNFGILEEIPATVEISEGNSSPVFTIKAIGELDTQNSFTWWAGTEYDLWVEINTSDNTSGLKVETVYDDESNTFISTLWADKIKDNASGDYFCTVKDIHGLSLNSSTGKIIVK